MLEEPITELEYFAESVEDHLHAFALRNASNLSFGARFLGYEGLDPDGVRILADAALAADEPLLAAEARAAERGDPAATGVQGHGVLERIAFKVRPNAAYILSWCRACGPTACTT